MELPDPYNALPIRDWLKIMRATKTSYATAGVRFWIRGRRKVRLDCVGRTRAVWERNQ